MADQVARSMHGRPSPSGSGEGIDAESILVGNACQSPQPGEDGRALRREACDGGARNRPVFRVNQGRRRKADQEARAHERDENRAGWTARGPVSRGQCPGRV